MPCQPASTATARRVRFNRMTITVAHLRLLACYHGGLDLAQRLAHAETIQRQQRIALEQAADEIERLQAKVHELEGGRASEADAVAPVKA